MPKIGPLKALDFNIPTPKTENMYFASINLTAEKYGTYLKAVHAEAIDLADDDLDSGKPTVAGEYSLADNTYAKLLSHLADHKFGNTTAPLQRNILIFYADPAADIETKKDPERWQKVQTDIEALRAFTPNTAAGAQLQTQPPAQPREGATR